MRRQNSPPPTSLEVANLARGQAARMRAEALLGVADGLTTIWDVIGEAAADAHRAVLKIRLRQLLLAQEGWGEGRADSVIRKTLATTGEGESMSERRDVQKMNLSWLLDSRTGGNRLAALADAVKCSEPLEPPWPGFPYSLPPVGNPLYVGEGGQQ